MVYFVMTLALFADEDYEEFGARLTKTLWGSDCWDADWEVPTPGRDHPGPAAAWPGTHDGGVRTGR
jgi:hypothetical protein